MNPPSSTPWVSARREVFEPVPVRIRHSWFRQNLASFRARWIALPRSVRIYWLAVLGLANLIIWFMIGASLALL